MGVWKGFRSAVCGFSLMFGLTAVAEASVVAVHDPSVVLVYKDAAGNSYPEQDASGSRTKYYYVFGTMGGAAYSLDLNNWVEAGDNLTWKVKYSSGGVETDDFTKIIHDAAVWGGHSGSSDDAKGNYWAPDIIYNKAMKKWCIYYSEAGEDWRSTVGLLTSDKIEGPYEFAGNVFYGGVDSGTSGVGNEEYKKVTGSSTVDVRYYTRNSGDVESGWHGDYGVSAIDPNVIYDQSGNLWLIYGSWSGGIFMLKLDAKTGLRDYTYTYGSSAVWSGTSLQSDPYMGIHIAGGHYVSGEGPYVEYMVDPDGVGYYYLFVSYGFYSPDGGYSMRVFRSKDVTGPYVDVDGTPAIFSAWEYNYGTNTKYGFPIIQNYRWSWWEEGYGEIANGHNSLLTDDDGRHYVVYHRKYTNNTAWHNVETHELVFNKNGWIVALPFEHRVGYGLPAESFTNDDIVGEYGTILHEPFAQKDSTLPVNTEKTMTLSADGKISGSYSGTWSYDYAKGRHFITLTVGGVTYNGVMARQLANDVNKQTVTFTAMNGDGTRAFWGYRVPKTRVSKVDVMKDGSESVTESKEVARDFIGAFDGGGSYTTTFNTLFTTDYKFSGDFDVRFHFMNYGNGASASNWDNYIVRTAVGESVMLLRADAYAMDVTGSITYNVDWEWEDFPTLMRNADVVLTVSREDTTVTYSAVITSEDGQVYHYTAVNTGVSTDDMTLSFTCEKSAVDIFDVETLNYPEGKAESSSSVAESSSSEAASSDSVAPAESSSSVTDPDKQGLAGRGTVPASLSVSVVGSSLELALNASGMVKFQVFDLMGHKVDAWNRNLASGTHRVSLENLSCGRYVVRLQQHGMSRVIPVQIR